MAEKPPTIALVGPYPPIRGGISQHAARLAAAFIQGGSAVTVVSWRSQYPGFLYPGDQAPVGPGLPTHSLRWWSFPSWWRARDRIETADVVVFPWVSPVHALPLRVIVGTAQQRVVTIVHNAAPHEALPLSDISMRWLLDKVDGIVAHSDTVEAELREIIGDREIQVVPLPANLDLEPTALPSGPPRLLFFGYIRPYKGVDLLIEALAVLRERGHDIAATIAGESWRDSADLVRLAEEQGVADLIDFHLGYVTDDQVPALLRDHHLVVQPYRSASQSGVIPLAYAAGRGVVVTPVGGLVEAVQPGVNGTVAAAVDAGALADAVLSAIDQVDALAIGAATSQIHWSDVAQAVLDAAGWSGRPHD